MTYKSILTVVSDGPNGTAVLEPALDLADRNSGHLEVMAIGLDRTQTGFNYAELSAVMLQSGQEEARRIARELAGKTLARLKNANAASNVSTAVAPAPDMGRLVARHARFSDLVVMPLPYGQGSDPDIAPLIEAALFDARAPVMLFGPAANAAPTPKRIVLGWNESSEALAATRAALPMLKAAENVHITVIDPPEHGPDRSDPGGLISQMLARHGVHCEVDVLSKSMPRVGDVLLRHASDKGADMIVMGAYGHSRFREAVFGGATRHLLEHATMPVFMAH